MTLAATPPYTAILMDLQMPEEDGLSATRRLRARAGGEDLRVIAMSANAFSEDYERCLAAGMNDFLPKPFTPRQLCAVLARVLERERV
jgi:CheY-like chemotaxis protein